MSRRRWIAVVLSSTLALAMACGLSSVGIAPGNVDGDGAVTGEGGGPDRSTSDGGDAPIDVDAMPDVLTCPMGICNGGCDGGTCTIDCSTGCAGNNVNCPPGFACNVRCTASDQCSLKTITCPSTGACRVDCLANNACQNITVTCGVGPCRIGCGDEHSNACNGMTVNAAGTNQFCLACNGPGGDPGCNSLTCSVQSGTCKKFCNGGNSCNSIGTCENCGNVNDCP